MTVYSYTLAGTANADNLTIRQPDSNNQWRYVYDGLAGVDSLSFDRLPQSQFRIYQDATGIHVDSVSTASHMIYVTLNNVETLKFSNGATVVNLTTMFDTTAPLVSSFSPTDEATAVALSSNLVLTFNESVQRGTGNITLRNAAGTVIETFNAATSTNLTFSGAVVTVNPSADLAAGTTYYLDFAAGAVKDTSGNAYAGTTTYNFTTVSNNNLPTGSVSIAGTATQGQTLTASNSLADADGLGTVSYQWKANGVAISGATASTYTLTQSEVGKAITVVASYTDQLGKAESVSSSATAAVANVNDLATGSVTIAGTATQGQTLTASNTLADADGLGTVSYQWKADGSSISGATSSTYTLTQSEVGKAITVVASYTDLQGTAESKTSSATAAVANVNDQATGSVSIAGTATQGQTLTASNSLADVDGLGTVSYQWKANGVAISGATSSTYTLTQSEVGKAITVVASYTDLQGTAESKTSTATAAVANVNDAATGSVSISGTATQGQTLTASNTLADADGLGTVSYQWKADGSNISGATSSTYVLTQSEVGKAITVVASYTDLQGTAESKTSSATAAVANVNDAATGSVSISGTATQGQTLTASNTLADADGLGTVSYQWKADGSNISGATSSTYVLTQSEVGKAITVVASYTDLQGTAESKTSSATAAVANVNDLPTGGVSISGTATQGQTLTASNTLADADGLGTVSYQWKADGVAISGATASTYTLTQSEVGKAITVVASYTDLQGTAESKTSAATALVYEFNNAPTGSVGITGTATQGQTLTASNTLADADGMGTVSYQWKADGSNISGATSSTYTLTQSEVGKAITVVASYTDQVGKAESVSSSATAAVANVNDVPTGSVSISGTTTQGQTLTASNTLADVDGMGTVSYQWKADGSNISGATASTYTLTQSEVGKAITVVASYTDLQGTAESKTSSASAAVANVNDVPTGSVAISGTATQGQTLTASNTLADADGLGTVSYQWKADGSNISGATSSTYTLTQSEVGKAITVVASYTDLQGTAESKTSSATAAVANVNDLPTGGVSIAGTASQGQTLTASNSLADADGLGTVSYQWKADGSNISGATFSTYTLTQSEVGKAITVVASYTDLQGTAESKTSSATAAVANVNDLATGSVSIAGTATQGQTLTASNTLADADGMGTVSYQWKADGSSISGATASTYTLTQSEVGKAITVVASFTDLQGTAESKTSSATTSVANVNDLPTGGVSISGSATQGQTLTASNNLADADGLGTVSYQWKADGVAISGATASTYTLTQSEVGKAITVVASYTDLQGHAETKASGSTSAVGNANDAPVTGSESLAHTLTLGVVNSLSGLSVDDVDGDRLTLSMVATGGELVLPLGVLDEDNGQPGVQISGSVLEINALLQALQFAPTAVDAHLDMTISDGIATPVSYSPLLAVEVPAGYNASDSDADGIDTVIEQAVPGLITASGTVLEGDGNGDGVKDIFQTNVSSALLQVSDGSGHTSQSYATLVAGSDQGKTTSDQGAVITLLTQDTSSQALQDIPQEMNAPMGLLAFAADLATAGETVQFSIYVSSDLGVNGYWKQTPEGQWVNLASAPYGGQTVTEGDLTRLDFGITDGGIFDNDHEANGRIDDPGVIAAFSMSLIETHPHPLIVDYWF